MRLEQQTATHDYHRFHGHRQRRTNSCHNRPHYQQVGNSTTTTHTVQKTVPYHLGKHHSHPRQSIRPQMPALQQRLQILIGQMSNLQTSAEKQHKDSLQMPRHPFNPTSGRRAPRLSRTTVRAAAGTGTKSTRRTHRRTAAENTDGPHTKTTDSMEQPTNSPQATTTTTRYWSKTTRRSKTKRRP